MITGLRQGVMPSVLLVSFRLKLIGRPELPSGAVIDRNSDISLSGKEH